MAQRIVVQFVDDLDGTALSDGQGGTVTFGLDGTSYEIDLSSSNAERLRGALAEYISVARKVSGARSGARRSSATRGSSTDAAVVREWARTKGLQVSERGRVSADIVEAYKADH